MSSSRKTDKTTIKNAFVAVGILLVVLFAVGLRSLLLKPYDKSKLVYTEPTTEITAQQSTEAEKTEVATTNKNGYFIVTKEANSTSPSPRGLSTLLVRDGYWYFLSNTRGDQFYRYAFTKSGTVLKDLFEKDYYRFEQERKFVIIEREELTYSVNGNTVSIHDGDKTINYTFDSSTGKLTRTFSANGIKYVEDVYRHANYKEYIEEHWVLDN